MDDERPSEQASESAADGLAAEIRRRREDAGLSQRELARRIGYTRAYVAIAERVGGTLPSQVLVQALDNALAARGELVDLRKAAQLEADAIRNQLTGLVNVDGARPDGRVGTEEDDVRRRRLLSLIAQLAVASPLVERLEDVRRRLDGVLSAELTDRDADDWEQAVASYSRDVGTVPATQLLADLAADFEDIKPRIADASGLLRLRLIHSGAQLAALTAISLLYLREQRSAERWWRTASRAAEGARDPKLAALVSGRQAVFSLHGAPSRVFSLADAAIAHGRNAPCVGVISALAARAQLLSEVGRHAEAVEALHEVTAMFERLPESALTDHQSQWNWAEQRLRHVESHVHAYAGRVNEAQEAHAAASKCYPTNSYQGRTQVAMHRAIAMIRAGDVGGGAEHLTVVLDRLEPWQRSDGLILRSGEAVLNTVPLEQRAHRNVATASNMIRTIMNS